MPNRTVDNGVMTNDTAAIATLNIRTTALEGRVNELTNAVNGVQSSLATKIDSIATTLSSKIDERGRPQWAIYIAGLMAVASLYAYIDNSKIGPLKEKDADIIAGMKDINQLLRSELVPQWVHQKDWAQRDERFKQMEERIRIGEETFAGRMTRVEGATNDRIKRLEDQYSQTYSARDALQNFQQRIDKLEMTLKHQGG